MVQSVREIMNAIQGPGIISLNPQLATSIPLMASEDGTNPVFNTDLLTAGNMNGPTSDLVEQASNDPPRFKYRGHDQLLVRRGPVFTVGLDAVVTDRETYANNAARTTSNAPDRSLFGLPYIFSNWEPNPSTRSLYIKLLHKWIRQYTTTFSTGTTITVWKLDTLNSRIANHQPFDNNTTLPFPHDVVPLDLSTYQGPKLAFFGTRIVDLSDTFEGTITVPANTTIITRDADLATVLDKTLIKQDIDFGLFLSYPPIAGYLYSGSTHLTVDAYDFEYDPVEAIFSYLTVKKYEQDDGTLAAMVQTNSSGFPVWTDYGVNLLMSYRLAASYLIQEAKKQLRYWLTNAGLISTQTYSLHTLINYLTGPILFHISNDADVFSTATQLAWIPYEYVKYYNDSIEFDSYGYEAGKAGLFVPKKVRKPRSYTIPVNTSWQPTVPNQTPYYQKYGLANEFGYSTSHSLSINAWPISLIDVTHSNGHIYKTIGNNNDNIIHYDHVDNSEYFPEPDIVTDI